MITVRQTFDNLGSLQTWTSLLHVELIRTKNSMALWFPFIGLGIGIVSSTFSFWTSGARDASGSLSWQAMYVTGMAAPLIALLAGVVEHREKKYRSGGTNIRAVSPSAIRTARILVLIGITALFHILNFGTSWLIAVLNGRSGASSLLTAGLLAFIGSIPLLAIFSLIGRIIPLVPTLLISVVYQVVGTLGAELQSWTYNPASWPIRLMLPVLGVHSNGVPLAPDSDLNYESPVKALMLNFLLAIVAMVCVILSPEKRPKVPSRSPQKSSGFQRSTTIDRVHADDRTSLLTFEHQLTRRQNTNRVAISYAALHCSLSRSSAVWLTFVVGAIFLLMAMIYPPEYISGFYTYFILPLGSGILPVLTWSILAPAWQLMVLESSKMRSGYILWQASLILFLTIITGSSYAISGGQSAETFRLIALWVMTGIALTTFSTAVCITHGSGATIACAILVTVISATLGGDVLGETILWIIALPAWPEIANTPNRLQFAIITQILLITLNIRWSISALRQFERTA